MNSRFQKGTILSGLFCLIASVATYADTTTIKEIKEVGLGSSAALSWKEVYLSYAVLVFALIVIGAILWVFSKNNTAISSAALTKMITSVVIINSVLFLITCGYSQEQIQPAFGLLGALAGYVLGQQSSKEN